MYAWEEHAPIFKGTYIEQTATLNRLADYVWRIRHKIMTNTRVNVDEHCYRYITPEDEFGWRLYLGHYEYRAVASLRPENTCSVVEYCSKTGKLKFMGFPVVHVAEPHYCGLLFTINNENIFLTKEEQKA